MASKKAASKTPDAEDLTRAYMDFLLDKGCPPSSVYSFCKEQGIAEKLFYAHFASFAALEGKLWSNMVEETRQTLEADEDYSAYPSRQKLAAFYYTFLELALNSRSYLLLRFPGVQLVNPPVYIKKFQAAFEEFIKPLLEEAKDNKEIATRGKLNNAYPGLFFAQMLFIIDFWLKDESDAFERTDALVEKSVSLAFDLVGTQVIDSALDFVRFMAGETKAA